MSIKPKVLDIYHGDLVLSFEQIQAAGIRGIIHKATEGPDKIDPKYIARRRDGVAARLLWGAYHFMRPGDMAAQAEHFVGFAAPDTKTLMAADHEDPKVSLAQLREFIEAVEAKIGRKMVIYSGSVIKDQIPRASADLRDFMTARRLWLPQYGPAPHCPPGWEKPWLWQYTGDGSGPQPHTVNGAKGNVDLNSYDGTDEQLTAEWA
jgi:lysozyme